MTRARLTVYSPLSLPASYMLYRKYLDRRRRRLHACRGRLDSDASANHQYHREAERNPATAPITALDDSKTHVHFVPSGSVTVVELPLIAAFLYTITLKLSIRVIHIQNAARFLTGQFPEPQEQEQPAAALFHAPQRRYYSLDEDDRLELNWNNGESISDIEFRRWSHLHVIALLTANTLTKVSSGFSDNLRTSVGYQFREPERGPHNCCPRHELLDEDSSITAEQIRA